MIRDWVVCLSYALHPDPDTRDSWEDTLADWEASTAAIPGRGTDLTLRVDNTTVDDALARARTAAATVVDDDPIGIEVITSEEQERRAAPLADLELMSAAEIAEELNVSRQRVHQLRAAAAFPQPLAEPGGRAVWDADAIRTFATTWQRQAGRPRTADTPATTYTVVWEFLCNGEWRRETDQRPTESEAQEFYRQLLNDPNVRGASIQP